LQTCSFCTLRGVQISKQIFSLEDAMLEDRIFAGSLLESSPALRTHRSWTTLTSFGLQSLVIGLILLLPLLSTVKLPSSRVLPTPVSWGAPPPAAPVHHQNATIINQSNFVDNVLVAPREVPHDIAQIEESSAPPQISFGTIGVLGSTGSGSGDGAWRSLGDSGTHPVLLPAPAPIVRPFRSSNLLAGSLVRRVQPVYPPLARNARVQGSVVLFALISKAGAIENLRVVSGHPMLVPAAIEAVSQWRYRPYILNSEAIEVETQITVTFSLSGN
jgi:protein TonB